MYSTHIIPLSISRPLSPKGLRFSDLLFLGCQAIFDALLFAVEGDPARLTAANPREINNIFSTQQELLWNEVPSSQAMELFIDELCSWIQKLLEFETMHPSLYLQARIAGTVTLHFEDNLLQKTCPYGGPPKNQKR